MAWPPPIQPTNMTNSTPQLDTHPTTHNDLAETLNTDYQGQIQANLDGLAAHQSVYQGVDPGALATIRGQSLRLRILDDARVRRYSEINGTDAGSYPYIPGGNTAQQQSDVDVFTTGVNPVAALRVAYPSTGINGWPQGGIAIVHANAMFSVDTGDAIGSVGAGIRYDGGADLFQSNNYRPRIPVAGSDQASAVHLYMFAVPQGTLSIEFVCGVANVSGPTLRVGKYSVQGFVLSF